MYHFLLVQSAIFVPGISVTNNNTRLKNMDMRKVKFVTMILAASLLTACGSSKKEQSVNEETAAARTQETENLLANLKKIPSKGIMLGHHDDTVYGIGWEGEEGRSDVKSVCGDYPAVISFDLGELELGNAANLDKAVEASQEQLEAIRRLEEAGVLETLPDKLKLTASLRQANPELSLSELAEEFDPPVTKSCLNHRLRKLVDLSKKL